MYHAVVKIIKATFIFNTLTKIILILSFINNVILIELVPLWSWHVGFDYDRVYFLIKFMLILWESNGLTLTHDLPHFYMSILTEISFFQAIFLMHSSLSTPICQNFIDLSHF